MQKTLSTFVLITRLEKLEHIVTDNIHVGEKIRGKRFLIALHDKMLALACIHSVLEQEACRKLIIHARCLMLMMIMYLKCSHICMENMQGTVGKSVSYVNIKDSEWYNSFASRQDIIMINAN